jgi:aryl-alcohol dehydrogenase-like predicted oxidoreductase
VALAWLLARKPFIVPIFGTRHLDRATENLGAADVTLTPDDMHQIEQAASQIKIVGARLPESVLQFSYL